MYTEIAETDTEIAGMATLEGRTSCFKGKKQIEKEKHLEELRVTDFAREIKTGVDST